MAVLPTWAISLFALQQRQDARNTGRRLYMHVVLGCASLAHRPECVQSRRSSAGYLGILSSKLVPRLKEMSARGCPVESDIGIRPSSVLHCVALRVASSIVCPSPSRQLDVFPLVVSFSGEDTSSSRSPGLRAVGLQPFRNRWPPARATL
ncbi:hypothetical protein C8R44DRAFT_981382 [Mycena epipterygia]|nr:hypothetical protein C8R44DRAFT_981382 [Mycena epipterygia]